MCPSAALSSSGPSKAKSRQEQVSDSVHVISDVSFAHSTSEMVEQLKKAGLADQGNFQTWRELLFESGEMNDARVRAMTFSQIHYLIPYILRLPVATPIKEGIQRQYNESALQYAKDSKTYTAQEVHRLERQVREGPTQRLETVYRTRKSTARMLATIFGVKSAKNIAFSGNQNPTLGDVSDAFVGPVWSMFRTLVYGLSEQLQGSENAVVQLYSDAYGRQGRVEPLEQRIAKAQPQKLREAAAALEALGGLKSAERSAILARFGGEYPLYLAPQMQYRVKGEWVGKAEAFGYRLPCGTFIHTRDDLERQQLNIERGEIRGYSLVLRGRVDQRFLDWLSGSTLDGHDPIPDIEILYALSLPSGREYQFTLKAARAFSIRERGSIDQYPPEDRRVIDCLGKYFTLPEHKRSFTFLTKFRACDFAPELHEYLQKPEKIADIAVYEAIRSSWNQSLNVQLLEAENEFDAAFFFLSSDAVPTKNMSDFIAYCRRRLQRLPDEQRFHPPEYFRLSPAETEQIVREYLPRAFRIISEERGRERGESSEIQQARHQLGYTGPVGGFHLPLDHMLMDFIIDMRKRERYRHQVAEKTGRPPSEIDVPADVGRPYDLPGISISIEELPTFLAQLENDKRFPRDIRLRVYDPTREQPYSEYPIDQAHGLLKEIGEVNRLRFDKLARELEAEMVEARAKGEVSAIEQTCFETFSQMWRSTSLRIEQTRKAQNALEQERKARCAELHRELTAQQVSKVVRVARFSAVRSDFDARHAKMEKALRDDYEKSQFLWHVFMPTHYVQTAMRGHSIVDTRKIKLIYSIGSDGKARLSVEMPTKKGDRRATHSQQLGGHSMFAGGEIVLAQHDHIFHNLGIWQSFNEWLKSQPKGVWDVSELNNSTGHYMIFSDTLPYAQKVIFPALEAVGISTKHAQLVDRLLPGLRLRGAGMYRF